MKTVTSKKKCCKSRKRCKTCPVVMKRLEKGGYVERRSKRSWVLLEMPVPKAELAAARAR